MIVRGRKLAMCASLTFLDEGFVEFEGVNLIG